MSEGSQASGSMATPPPANVDPTKEEVQEVLRVVIDYGMVSGRDLKRRAGITSDHTLRKALLNLSNKKVVTIGGSLSTPSGLLEAFVAPLPSGQAMAQQIIRE